MDLALSLIGVYLIIFTVLAGFLRNAWFRLSERIYLDEWPQADYIELLLKSIYLVREQKNYDLEEYLYARLIFIYRSPETMIDVTRRTVEEYSEEYFFDSPPGGSRTSSAGGSRTITAGGSRTTTAGGSRTNTAGGSRTNTAGGSRTTTAGGSRPNDNGGARTNTDGGSRTNVNGGSRTNDNGGSRETP